MLVSVFSGVFVDALALEGTEDGSRAIVLLEIRLLVVKLVVQLVESVLGRLQRIACIGQSLGF